VQHIISECPILAQEQYIKGHVIVCAQMHFNICKEIVIKLDSKHCTVYHVTKSVETSHDVKGSILWNQQARTDRTIVNNKPDIIIRDNKQGTCLLMDVAIPGDRNVIKKEAQKVLKYTDHVIEIRRMWNVEAAVISVIIGGEWNHFRIIQKIPEQRTGKARN
jgi:hypothetical protein